VLPPNTYRLTGKVLESGLGVSGATVAVLSGVGAGSSATTGYDGQYHLYGVAGTVQIKVTKAGYVDIVKTFDVFQNEVLDFPEARQSAGMPTITGPYIVSLQLDPGCPTVATDPRILPVPAELRQPRLYAAQVTQDGPSLTVTLTDPTFAPRSNKFSGRIEPDAINFSLGDGYVGYGPDDAITERISSSLELSWEGVVRAARSGSAIVGRLDGWVQVFDPSRPFVAQLIGECNAPNNLFSMKPTSGTLR
jgi:hypothetical protein